MHVHRGKDDRSAGSGQRSGHRARAHSARLRRHLDRLMARATPTAKRWTSTIVFAFRPTIPNTRCGASGSPRKKKRATTTDSRTRASGRSATSRTRGRFSGPPTGRAIRTRTANSPTPCWRKWQGSSTPLLLVQDYHFALLPRMIKEARPDVRVAIFWHIPWPNPEAFGICPWQRELLDGLLGADLVGFHTQAHCNNFLETVDAALESRIEWERFAVKRKDQTTLVRPFPISVDFRESQSEARRRRSLPTNCAPRLLKNLGVEGQLSRRGCGPHRLHEGNHRALPGRRALSGEIAGRIAGNSRSCRSARPAAPISSATTIWCAKWKRGRRASTRVSRQATGSPSSAHPASQPRRNPAVLPRGRLLHGHVAARRHESGGQGIRRRARGRRRRADPEPVHRRRPRTARCASS